MDLRSQDTPLKKVFTIAKVNAQFLLLPKNFSTPKTRPAQIPSGLEPLLPHFRVIALKGDFVFLVLGRVLLGIWQCDFLLRCLGAVSSRHAGLTDCNGGAGANGCTPQPTAHPMQTCGDSMDNSLNHHHDASFAAVSQLVAAGPLNADTQAQLDADAKARQQARTAATKARKARCVGHATSGASAQAFPVAPGREALPVLPEKARDVIFRLTPVTSAAQIHMLQKQLCTPQEPALKSSTRDERLMLAQTLDILRAGVKLNYVERALDYALAPTGLSREDHQKTKVQLWELGPYHIINIAAEATQPVYQALLAEAQAAWTDPVAEGLACVTTPIPARPNSTLANSFLQVLGERAKFLPEALRPILADLAKILKQCLPSKLHDFLQYLQEVQLLSSSALLARLLNLGQRLPQDFTLDAMLHPQQVEDGSYDLHARLMATMIPPKTKQAPRKRRSTKTTAAAATTPATSAAATPNQQSAPASTTAPASVPATSAPATTTTKTKGKGNKPKTDLESLLLLDEIAALDATSAQDALAPSTATSAEVAAPQAAYPHVDTAASLSPEAAAVASSVAACTVAQDMALDAEPQADAQLAEDAAPRIDAHAANAAATPASDLAALGSIAPTASSAGAASSAQSAASTSAQSATASGDCSVAANSDETWRAAFSPIEPDDEDEEEAQDDEVPEPTTPTSKLDKRALTRQYKLQHKRHLKKVRKQIAAARRRHK